MKMCLKNSLINNFHIGGRYITQKINLRKINEKRFEDASNVNEIIIDSSIVSVNVSTSNLSKIEVHFYGKSDVEDFDFEVYLLNSKLIIKLHLIGDYLSSNLKLDVIVPHKIFRLISINSLSADAILSKHVSAECLEFKTKSGNIETYAMFMNVFIETLSGDVKVFLR